MELSKWISLFIAALYIVVFVCFFVIGIDHEHESRQEAFERLFWIVGFMLLWLGSSLGCIWWGDDLAEGLIGAKYGLVSSTSPGWLVKLMGWILLLLPAFIATYIWSRGRI